MNIQVHKKPTVKQPMLSPQQLSLLNKNKLIEMVFKNYQQSQVNSTKRKQIETACTILSGSSNNETIEDNVNTSQVQPPTVKKSGINFKSNNPAVVASQFHIKSADATKRSQSGEGPKSKRNYKIIKNSKESANQEKGGSFMSFFTNPKDLEFLTKTIGVMPSHAKQSQLASNRKQTSQGKKSGHSSVENNQPNSKINRKKNVSSEAIKISGVFSQAEQNYPHLYKSFQNHPQTSHHITQAAATKSSAGKPRENQHGKISSQISTANTSSQFLSQKFLQTLKAFTNNYYGIQEQKKLNRLQKQQSNQKQQKHSKKRDRSESEAIKSAKGIQSSSRQLKFGQIMEELEKFSLSAGSSTNLGNVKTKTQDPILETEDSIAEVQSSMITESELEFSQCGFIRASTYKRNADSETRKKITHYKSEERKNEGGFFTQEYLENRYVNSRVEMELEEFKKEIESKFQKSSMKSYTFDRQKIHSKKLNQSFVKKPLQMSEYHTDVPLEKVKSIKAMFQNFVKQSFDVKSKAHQNILVTSDEKIEPDFNSFTQLTFDSSHPNYASNYVGMKKGNQSLTTNQMKKQVSDKQNQSLQATQKQTPKNYSLQLNQVVKKILSDQQNIGEVVETVLSTGGNQQVQNTSGLDTMYEPCFYTTNGQQRLDSHSNFVTRDYRQKINVDEEGNNRFSCSNSSKGGKQRTTQKEKDRSKYRSESNNKLQKNSLINKFFRQQNQAVNSPQSRQQKIKQVKEGASSNLERKFSKPVSVLGSNLSTNRQASLANNKHFIQTKRQNSSSNKTTAKSTQKNSRLPSSSKKTVGSNILVNVSNFQVQTAANSNITFHIQDKGVTEQSFAKDPKQSNLMLKNSQIKRSVEGAKQDLRSKVTQKKPQKDANSVAKAQQQSITLLQRSFHHQVQQQQNSTRPIQNAKSSTTSSPHSQLKHSNQKSQQKVAKVLTLSNQAQSSKNTSKGNLKVTSTKQNILGQKQIVLSKICSAERVNTEQMQLNQLHL